MSTHPDPESPRLPESSRPPEETGREHAGDLPGSATEQPQRLSEPFVPVAIPPGVEHALCHRHPVQSGPESGDWSVVAIDGVPVLVRPNDLLEHVHERYVIPSIEDLEDA